MSASAPCNLSMEMLLLDTIDVQQGQDVVYLMIEHIQDSSACTESRGGPKKRHSMSAKSKRDIYFTLLAGVQYFRLARRFGEVEFECTASRRNVGRMGIEMYKL